MAAPKGKDKGVLTHYRYLNGNMVIPRMFMPGKFLGGQIDEISILDEKQKPIKYQNIGISAKEYWKTKYGN